MQVSQEIPLTGTFQNLATLIKTALAVNGQAPWEKSGFNLEVKSDRSNASGTRIQITSDFVNNKVAYELLPEEAQSFSGGGAVHNSVILIDKLIRIVDASDVATTGKAQIIFEWA